MTGAWRLAAHDDLLGAALDEAGRQGVFLIGRLEDVETSSVLAYNGELERVDGGRLAGLGVQVFTRAGHCGFASTNRLGDPREARDLVARAAALAHAAERVGGEAFPDVWELTGGGTVAWPSSARPIGGSALAERQRALLEVHRRAVELAAGFATRTSFALTDDEWRVVRSDGTDVRFRLPRGLVRHAFTGRGGGQAASTSASVCGADERVLFDPDRQARLDRRARRALERTRAVVDAPAVASGQARLVLDPALAKGLAHEAFGHAAETDIARASILAQDGRLRLGERVAQPGVSVVDGPIEGDYGYQPVSANGVPRQTVEIIRDGVLHAGLGDLFSHRRAGVELTGACRAESYRARPLPRMSNIRLVLERPAALDGDPDELTPAEVGERLRAAGLIGGQERVLLLAGYGGGQASPSSGDFVFSAGAVFDLTEGAAPRRPALFSGKSRAALGAVEAALGELVLDAPGQCGKGGQSVATCGGSHAFVVLAPHPEVTVGGS